MRTVSINGVDVELTDAAASDLLGPAPDEPIAPSQTIPVPMLRQRVEKLGMMDDFSAYLVQYPPLLVKILSLENGVNPADPSFADAFTAMQIPQAYQDYILAPASAGVPEAPPNV